MFFDGLVERQGGVVGLAQAVEHGMAARSVQRHARDGSWRRLRPAVYLVGGHRLDDRGEVRGLAVGGGALHDRRSRGGVLARDAARAPGVIDLTVPAAAKPRPQPGIRIRRRDLHPTDRVGIEGVWSTGTALTVLETAVALADGSSFLDRALQKWVRFPGLYRAYCRNVGRAGWTRAGELITAAADRAESAAERLLVGILRDAGITGWQLGHPVGPYRIDLAFPAARVAVEVDGWAWHVDPERFRGDRRTGNVLTRAGWDVLRFTWHDLDGRPGEVVAEIRAMIEQTGTSAPRVAGMSHS